MLTARRIKKDKRKTTKNCFVENQMVLHEEETEITEIEDTSITDLIADSSQGFPNRSINVARSVYFSLYGHRVLGNFEVRVKPASKYSHKYEITII